MEDQQDVLRRRAAAVPWHRLQPSARLYLVELVAGYDQRAVAARHGKALGTINGSLQAAVARAGAGSVADLTHLAACYVGQGGNLLAPAR